MTTISATSILRSRHAQRPDKVLSTLLLRYPRWIHAEFMTHRQLSRNAASSRAIPVKKLIQDVMDNPAMPIHWGANEKGMQANQQLTGVTLHVTRDLWRDSCSRAIACAAEMDAQGAHKQIINRILEPYAHITVLASATEWSNFLALRDHPAAEPHIQILAREVRKELDREDNIQVLQPGQWHLPFVSDETWNRITETETEWLRSAIKMAVACCASTSYKTVDGFDMTLEKAVELHDKLVGASPLHASPAEHVAQADKLIDRAFGKDSDVWNHPDQHGNFDGFRQYRKMLPNECL
ncbi:FAD-dependent thymidylate synthase [Mesorhizobium sp.]|uniref:FAD-dependent thymidylate synthase n=1 Tax=Mesorhizobium sp. TaxID=1871066 RepID=UPI0025EB5216|nr:FAD-dependent thymidylate synthase [Mesorhizobium sp.]